MMFMLILLLPESSTVEQWSTIQYKTWLWHVTYM